MEHAKLVQLREELDFFRLVSLQLQKEGEHQLDLHDVRILFDDELIIWHPIVERHLVDNAAIIHNAALEKAAVKIQYGNEAALARRKRIKLKYFCLMRMKKIMTMRV